MVRFYLSDIINIMVQHGFETTVYPTQGPGDATKKVIEAAGNYDRVVACGGDGTLDEIVAGMMKSEKKVPIGYIPAGSTNDFGNSLGIDKDMLKAAEIAVGDQEFSVDIGSFNQIPFVYIAAFGLFTEVSYQTPQFSKNMLGHAAYILEGIKSLSEIPSCRMQVEYNGNVLYDEFIYGMVTNSNSVGGFKGLIAGDISLNDGLFEVTLIRFPRNPIELSDILAYLSGVNHESEMVYTFQTKEVRFTSNEKVAWTLDGENGGLHLIATVKNNQKALTLQIGEAGEEPLNVLQEKVGEYLTAELEIMEQEPTEPGNFENGK